MGDEDLAVRRHRARCQTVPDQRHRTPRWTRPGRGRTAAWSARLSGFTGPGCPPVSASTRCPTTGGIFMQGVVVLKVDHSRHLMRSGPLMAMDAGVAGNPRGSSTSVGQHHHTALRHAPDRQADAPCSTRGILVRSGKESTQWPVVEATWGSCHTLASTPRDVRA